MTGAVLETLALCKRFGALTVADGIEFRLEAGARHALIGPNGAGKTTFIDMLTGRLQPSTGTILLGGEDITRLAPAARVKHGLGRTFQINTLFGGLSVLDNVALGVAERLGVAGRLWRPAGAYREVRKEAMTLLESLGLAHDAGERALDLPYGRQRLLEIAIALGLKPRVLLLDEPAAGIPSLETARLLEDSTGCRPISQSSSSSTTWTSCFGSRAGSPSSCRERSWARARRPRSRRTGACARSIWGRGVAEALRLERVRAGYGATVVLEDVGFVLAERGSLAVLGRNGVGKTTLLATIMGHTTFHSGDIALRGRSLATMPAFKRNRAGIGYVPQARDIFSSLTVEENLTVARWPGRWTLEGVYELFPRLAERRLHMGTSSPVASNRCLPWAAR